MLLDVSVTSVEQSVVVPQWQVRRYSCQLLSSATSMLEVYSNSRCTRESSTEDDCCCTVIDADYTDYFYYYYYYYCTADNQTLSLAPSQAVHCMIKGIISYSYYFRF